MNGLKLLETAIGLIFIYLLLSLVATAMTEAVLNALESRGLYLRKAILAFFQEKAMGSRENKAANNDHLSNHFFNHPLFRSLNPGNDAKHTPSYLTPGNFISIFRAVLDEFDAESNDFEETLKKIKPEGLSKMLISIWKLAGREKESFFLRVEAWYEESTSKSRIWFKKHAFFISFICGLFIAGLTNADTNRIISTLTFDAESRTMLFNMAVDASKTNGTVASDLKNNQKEIYSQLATFQKSSILGWEDWPSYKEKGEVYVAGYGCRYFNYLANRFPGWLITALAISIGAPFWFDLLHKLIGVRNNLVADVQKKEEPKNAKSTSANS